MLRWLLPLLSLLLAAPAPAAQAPQRAQVELAQTGAAVRIGWCAPEVRLKLEAPSGKAAKAPAPMLLATPPALARWARNRLFIHHRALLR